MADDGLVIRGIDWEGTFPFLRIFRTFHIAFHFSKLLLGMALLTSVYCGGRILDEAWRLTHSRAVVGEVDAYHDIALGRNGQTFSQWRDDQRRTDDKTLATMLVRYNVITPQNGESSDTALQRALSHAQSRDDINALEKAIIAARQQEIEAVDTTLRNETSAAEDAYKAKPDAPGAADVRDDALSQAQRDHDAAITASFASAGSQLALAESFKGIGLFDMFFQYEIRQVNGVAQGVLANQWLSVPSPLGAAAGAGVLASIYNFLVIGPAWLFWGHTVFFVLFAAIFLFAWSLFGGAICRIAAVEFALNQRIPLRQALNFAAAKLLSFATAPLIPLAFILILGLVTSAVCVIGRIPVLGPIVIGSLFIFALLVGFVLALIILHTVGGFNLMFPTIAAEGSDSFDAVSRSFNYVYARPWRLAWYTGVAIVYCSATYLFIRTFIWLMLALTHVFVGLGFGGQAASTQSLFDAMWPTATLTSPLYYVVDWSNLNWAQAFGAICIQCWVMLIVSVLGAYAISAYFSANTIIYFLLRQKVDTTELDDIHIEESTDPDSPEFPEPAPGDASEAPEPAPSAPAAPAEAVVPPPSA